MVPTRADNPAVPLAPAEIAEDCRRCAAAGATVVHLHARDAEGRPTYRKEVFRETIALVRAAVPDIVVCVTTSGRLFGELEQRAEVLDLDGAVKPDMASLTLGSMSFPREASVNSPKTIQGLAEWMRERGIVPELAHSSRGGLARLLGEIDGLVDEIVMGVDAGSRDDTLQIARSGADVVFRFEHVGPPVRVRLLPLRHATGDWILSLDEDEGLDDRFGDLLGDLVSDVRYSHYWFPRRWLVGLAPPAYLHAAPWYPDWQLRLFRNQPARVWHTGRVHSGYRVMGLGCREERTAILHYEPLVLTAAERQAKGPYYRAHGGEGRAEEQHQSTAGWERRPLAPPPAAAGGAGRPRAGRLVAGVVAVPDAPSRPPWGAARVPLRVVAP
jgi:hypothetical protein